MTVTALVRAYVKVDIRTLLPTGAACFFIISFLLGGAKIIQEGGYRVEQLGDIIIAHLRTFVGKIS
jgi:hypothetical protein